MQVPLAIFVWDDGYGISVPKKLQTTKGSISEALKGFQKKEGTNGIDIYRVKAWDYAGMCEVFEAGIKKTRETHIPALFHVEEVTQPQGHSTSGSHERYKTPERLEWEREWDAIKKMRQWLIENELAADEELDEIETSVRESVRAARNIAWEEYQAPIRKQVMHAADLINNLVNALPNKADVLKKMVKDLLSNREPNRRDVMKALHQSIVLAGKDEAAFWIKDYYNDLKKENKNLYNTHLLTEGAKSTLKVAGVPATYDSDSPLPLMATRY